MGKKFVIGDIHGAFRALHQCMDRSSFDFEHDTLICLGDVCDGWPETRACLDLLMEIKNLIYLLGNHDTWTMSWMDTGCMEEIWLLQGGKATIQSFEKPVPEMYRQFFQRALPYHEDGDRLFVHAGFDPQQPIHAQPLTTLIWDRALANACLDLHRMGLHQPLTPYREVYIGHTPVPTEEPLHAGGIWMMDTGGGWSGKLSMMNLETYKIYQSDWVPQLYPEAPGRQKWR